MRRARPDSVRALAGLFVLGFLSAACHRHVVVKTSAGVDPVVKEESPVRTPPRTPPVVQDTAGIGIFFKDSGGGTGLSSEGRRFNLRTPGQRDSLRAVLRKERERWRATHTQDYQFLLRVGCFCPGPLGWLLMDVRNGQPVRARDRTGKSVAVGQWNTFSIDGLFDSLQGSLDRDAVVQVAFDPRWHFPTYVYTAALPGPDMWSITEARALRPSATR